MIDVAREIEKYASIDINKEVAFDNDELSIILQNATKAYERIGKQQFKSNTILEELIEIVEENKVKEDQIRDMRSIINKSDSNASKLLTGLLDINDAFEDMYLYVAKSEVKSLKEAINLQKEKNIRMLSLCGVTIIGNKTDNFDSNIYIAKELGDREDLDDGVIIEVLRCGYIYDGQVIRKAQVVINKKPDLI